MLDQCYKCNSPITNILNVSEIKCQYCGYEFSRSKTKGFVYVYFVLCKDGSIYTGSSNDVYRRFKDHQTGKGAKYTKMKGVEKLLAYRRYNSRSEALRTELSIKSYNRKRKLKIINDWKF